MSITQDMIDCWRVNYGLDKMSPADAADWWEARESGAPSGAVAALGLLLQEREAMRNHAEAMARVLDVFEQQGSDKTAALRDYRAFAMKDQP